MWRRCTDTRGFGLHSTRPCVASTPCRLLEFSCPAVGLMGKRDVGLESVCCRVCVLSRLCFGAAVMEKYEVACRSWFWYDEHAQPGVCRKVHGEFFIPFSVFCGCPHCIVEDLSSLVSKRGEPINAFPTPNTSPCRKRLPAPPPPRPIKEKYTPIIHRLLSKPPPPSHLSPFRPAAPTGLPLRCTTDHSTHGTPTAPTPGTPRATCRSSGPRPAERERASGPPTPSWWTTRRGR